MVRPMLAFEMVFYIGFIDTPGWFACARHAMCCHSCGSLVAPFYRFPCCFTQLKCYRMHCSEPCRMAHNIANHSESVQPNYIRRLKLRSSRRRLLKVILVFPVRLLYLHCSVILIRAIIDGHAHVVQLGLVVYSTGTVVHKCKRRRI